MLRRKMSRWRSLTMTVRDSRSPLARARSIRPFRPEVVWRAARNALLSTATGTGSLPRPYTIPGISPSRRSLRTWFFPRPSRRFASTVTRSMACLQTKKPATPRPKAEGDYNTKPRDRGTGTGDHALTDVMVAPVPRIPGLSGPWALLTGRESTGNWDKLYRDLFQRHSRLFKHLPRLEIRVVTGKDDAPDADVHDHLGAGETGLVRRVDRRTGDRDTVVGGLDDGILLGMQAQTGVQRRPRRRAGGAAVASTVSAVRQAPRRVVVPGGKDHAVFDHHRAHVPAYAGRPRRRQQRHPHKILIPTWTGHILCSRYPLHPAVGQWRSRAVASFPSVPSTHSIERTLVDISMIRSRDRPTA